MDSAARLDIYVANLEPKLSRSVASRLISEGSVLVNGKPQLKSSYKLHEDDRVKVNYASLQKADLVDLELEVLYEDKDCVVVDKPAGVLSHSKGAFNPEDTVATWLAKRWSGPESERAGIVHRLDRATSGVMIGAKTPEALSWLQKQFSQRKAKKSYVAVVSGVPQPAEAIIDMPIERNPKKPQTFRVGSNGKAAVTAYKLLESNGKISLLELRPTTGRTHQLRVHLNQVGHPILGDTLYGGKPAERLLLHAESLEITLPNRKRKIFESKPPAEFKKNLDA